MKELGPVWGGGVRLGFSMKFSLIFTFMIKVTDIHVNGNIWQIGLQFSLLIRDLETFYSK